MKATEILQKAASIMEERGKQYDKENGERSMGKAIAAFNAIKSESLSESDGWLLLAILKMVRDNTKPQPHDDSIHDLVAYSALYGESRLPPCTPTQTTDVKLDDGWIEWGGGACPLPDCTRHVVKRRCGDVSCIDTSPETWSWRHHGCGSDIIAYKVVE